MASGIYIDYSRYYSLSQILPASHALKYIYLSNFNAIKRIIAIRQFIKVHEWEEKSKIIIINIHSIYWLFDDDPGVRLWSAGCRSRFQGWLGRLNFMKSPFCLIDVITVRKDAGNLSLWHTTGSILLLHPHIFFNIYPLQVHKVQNGTKNQPLIIHPGRCLQRPPPQCLSGCAVRAGRAGLRRLGAPGSPLLPNTAHGAHGQVG